MMGRAILSCADVRHAFGGKEALRVSSFSVSPGDILGLAGPNGAGKTTLLKSLGFLLVPDQGDFFFDGRRIAHEGERAAARRNVTLLHQKAYLMKRSVADNVAYGLRVRGAPDARERTGEALRMVGLPPAAFGGRPWRALSGGEVQRVALAARLALRPKVLLLDEPTANLDDASLVLLQEAIRTAAGEWQCAVVIASHDLPWLERTCASVRRLPEG